MSRTYIDILNSEVSKQRNTGFKSNPIESKLMIPVLSNGFEFKDVEDFKSVESWRQAIAEKKLVPLFPVYELADASTEDTLFESGNFSRVTQKGTEIVTFECFISASAYAALKSYEELGGYGELFEFNDEGDYSGIFASDGVKVKGRKITSLEVTRIRATSEKVPYVSGRITFADKDDVLGAVIVKSELQDEHLEGIYDVELFQESATSSSVKFRAMHGTTPVTSLTADDFEVKDATGTVQDVSVVTPGADGVYEITGTGFATGYTINTKGVIVQSTIMYEAADPLEVTVS